MARKKKQRFAELLTTLKRRTARDTKELHPVLEGPTYRFTVWMPIRSGSSQTIFNADQIGELLDLFCIRFGGCSITAVDGRVPWEGVWLDETGNRVDDRHLLFVVYSAQSKKAIRFFQFLRWMLQIAGNQDIVVVELLPVEIVDAVEM